MTRPAAVADFLPPLLLSDHHHPARTYAVAIKHGVARDVCVAAGFALEISTQKSFSLAWAPFALALPIVDAVSIPLFFETGILRVLFLRSHRKLDAQR